VGEIRAAGEPARRASKMVLLISGSLNCAVFSHVMPVPRIPRAVSRNSNSNSDFNPDFNSDLKLDFPFGNILMLAPRVREAGRSLGHCPSEIRRATPRGEGASASEVFLFHFQTSFPLGNGQGIVGGSAGDRGIRE
jgi:hypothetical protein